MTCVNRCVNVSVTMKRIQRKRTKGWKMPRNTVYVGRPSKWGNPYRFNSLSRGNKIMMYKQDLFMNSDHEIDELIKPLKGKNLACWCPLVDDKGNKVPCHADILLEIANS